MINETIIYPNNTLGLSKNTIENNDSPVHSLPEVLFLTSLPPRECGIATYSNDLINSLKDKFSRSFKINYCAVISNHEKEVNTNEVEYTLNTDEPENYEKLANAINSNSQIEIILLQHEFGFFNNDEKSFLHFLNLLNKPIIIVFHTVLPNPNTLLRENVIQLASICSSIIVMTKTSAAILKKVKTRVKK